MLEEEQRGNLGDPMGGADGTFYMNRASQIEISQNSVVFDETYLKSSEMYCSIG